MDKWTEGETVKKTEKEKPSRWWILFHLWGGVCLKVFADTSGLFKLILGTPNGSDPASASSYAGFAGLLAAGIVVLGYFLSLTFVKAINVGSFSKKAKITIKVILPFAYLTGAVVLAMVTSPIFTSTGSAGSEKSTTPEASAIAPVVAMITVQSAEGFTDADLDQTGLKNLETWVVNTMIKKSKSKYAELGYDPNSFNPKVEANSVYVTVNGKKLAVIKVNMDNSVRSVTIMGIKGTELHRVTCIRNSNHDIPVWSGECGKKIQEVFGVAIQQ